MLNQNFQALHFKESKLDTPLFSHATKATAPHSQSWPHNAQYIVLNSSLPIGEALFKQAPQILPVYLHQSRSFICFEGECLWEYFLKKKHTGIVLTEEEIWTMLFQIVKALMVMQRHGYRHPHLKEYSIRRVNSKNFKLLYHPQMITQRQLTSKIYWYNFYFSPEELSNRNSSCNAEVFSLAAMTLNLMNPLDFHRSIYSSQEYKLDKMRLNEKMQNARLVYSNELLRLLEFCLIEDQNQRIKLQLLYDQLKNTDRFRKKDEFVHKLKPFVALDNSQSRKRKIQIHTPKTHKSTGKDIDSQQSSEHAQINNRTDTPKNQSNSKQIIDESTRAHQDSDKILIFDRGTFGMHPTAFNQENVQEERSIQKRDSAQRQDQQNQVNKVQISVQSTKEHNKLMSLDVCLSGVENLAKLIGKQGVWIDGDVYYGELVNGRRTGLGLQVFPEKQYYFGSFEEDLFHGDGFYYWNNHEHFLGEFQNGLKKKGSFYGKIKYTGEFKGQLRHGFGECIYTTGARYVGNWQNGLRDGEGTMQEITGDKFIGEFLKGKKHGSGSYHCSDCTIIGEWADDRIIDEVKIEYYNGSIYFGTVNNIFLKNGRGQLQFSNKSKYNGQFHDDEFIEGEVNYNNGEKYFGRIKEGKRHGFGEYFYNDGSIYKGQWQYGKKVSKLSAK